MNTEKKIWTGAILISLILHAGVFFFCPQFRQEKKEPPVMNVVLTMLPVPEMKAPEGKAQPEKKPAPAKPKPKKEIKPKKKAVKKDKKAERKEIKPVKEIETEISQNVSDVPVAEQTYDEPETTEDSGAGVESSGSGESGSGGGSGGGDEPVEVASLRIIKKVIPNYPAFSRKRRETGTVTIIVTIENGSVTKTEIEKSSGYGRLDASAERAVKEWKFDCPARIRARVPISFVLD